LTVLESIEGRTTDFIVTAEGKIMHGLSLIYILREIPGIKEFKIIQERPDYFRIMVVKDANFSERSEARIKKGFQKRVGKRIKIEINYMPKIEAEGSGKFRYIISKVEHPLSSLCSGRIYS